jgi:septal ring factor EnvC (AmiA/AmiB activator)
MQRLKVNEIKINNSSGDFGFIVAVVLLIAVICAGIVYYYRGAGGELESELADVERLNSELASETRQLQTDIASHGKGLASVTSAIGKSRERIKHVYTDIGQSAKEAGRAIEIIAECQNIIEAVKTQR